MLSRRDTAVWAHNYAFSPTTRCAYTTSSTFEKENKLDWHKVEPDNYCCAIPRMDYMRAFFGRLEMRARGGVASIDASPRSKSHIEEVPDVWHF